MDLTALAHEYDEQGFAIARSVWSLAEIREIERELEAYMRDVAPTLGPGDVYFEDSPARPIKSMFRLEQHADCFRQLLMEPRVLSILRAIWPDGEVVPEVVMFFGKPARDGSVTPAHQDNAFQLWNPPLALTATVAIDESTIDNGALTVQRGSHRLGLLPHRQSGVMGFSRCLIDPVDTTAYPEVRLCMQPGDLALHHINAVHSSGANGTDRSRRQIGLTYHCSLAHRDEAARATYFADLEKLHQQPRM